MSCVQAKVLGSGPRCGYLSLHVGTVLLPSFHVVGKIYTAKNNSGDLLNLFKVLDAVNLLRNSPEFIQERNLRIFSGMFRNFSGKQSILTPQTCIKL